METGDEDQNGDYVTRRELRLTLYPLFESNERLLTSIESISSDVRRLVSASNILEGRKAEHDRVTDRRRFGLMLAATVFAALIGAVFVYLVTLVTS